MAVDFGRFKCVVCLYRRSTREAVFRAIDTAGGAFEELFAEHPGALLVIEACANAEWDHDLAVARGLVVKVVNTAAEARKFKHLKRKTDKDDAKRLAELEAVGQLPTVTLPAPSRPSPVGDRAVVFE